MHARTPMCVPHNAPPNKSTTHRLIIVGVWPNALCATQFTDYKFMMTLATAAAAAVSARRRLQRGYETICLHINQATRFARTPARMGILCESIP